MVENIPHLTNTEYEESTFPVNGLGGSDVILVMGKHNDTQDLETINAFYSFNEAQTELDADLDESELLQAIFDIFYEGSRYTSLNSPTIKKVYAINMGADPTKADYETAMQNSVIKTDIDIELYLNNYDVTSYTAHMNAVASHLQTLENANMYRQAFFSLDPALDVDAKCIFTDPTENTYIRDNRVVIHENDGLLAKYAAKVACTPYYIDPCRDPYRTVGKNDYNEYSYLDMEKLLSAGIVCDYKTPTADPLRGGTITPVRAISTAHVLDDGSRGLATNTHIRRNVDYQWWYTDQLALQELKYNNTQDTRDHLKHAVESFFNDQLKLGSITPKVTVPKDKGYFVDVIPDETDAYRVALLRTIRPVSALYFIDIYSTISAPLQEVAPTEI